MNEQVSSSYYCYHKFNKAINSQPLNSHYVYSYKNTAGCVTDKTYTFANDNTTLNQCIKFNILVHYSCIYCGTCDKKKKALPILKMKCIYINNDPQTHLTHNSCTYYKGRSTFLKHIHQSML